MKYRLGTRKSELALKQSESIQKLLEKKGCFTELVLIESEGDTQISKPLYEIESEGPGLFTKRLEKALLENKIDLAVHSLKDLPTLQPAELKVAAIPKRESAHDCLILLDSQFDASQFMGLREKAVVGTSSLRRQAQLKAVRPDLEVVSLRGNVPTRLNAVRSGKVDAIVLAEAGLNRLGISLEGLRKQILPLERFVPAPGQGALAIEVRQDCPKDLLEAIQLLNDPATELSTQIERKILRELEGGCTLPLGVFCQKEGKTLNLKSFLGEEQGREQGVPVWVDFHRFDIQGAVEHTLVSQTVEYFRSRNHARK
ncbi:MAG: hydroxymethylbilane synthase [Proteobacteria bacterium]|nr:hydroxymethylbilane synthase [Pseudomonadota bacterium]